jgi:hypothetical protein
MKVHFTGAAIPLATCFPSDASAQVDIIDDNVRAPIRILKQCVRVDNNKGNGICIPIEFTAKPPIDKFLGDVSGPSGFILIFLFIFAYLKLK